MENAHCPYCSEPLKEGSVSLGRNSDSMLRHGTVNDLYFLPENNKPKRILGFFDERSALHCYSCGITIINKSFSERPSGVGQKAYSKNQLIRLNNLMQIFSSVSNFNQHIKHWDRHEFYKKYLTEWEGILSDETTVLLQENHPIEYQNIKAFYNILKTVNKDSFGQKDFFRTDAWLTLNEKSQKALKV